jgi:Concanavalin A-like lectin/glucanases superfamily
MALHHMLRAAVRNLTKIVDPYFEYVTLLLNGDNAANGAQNNTFLDSSTNNFTITRNGNTTQGSFSPYGNLWSNYFDGSGDYLSVANNAALSFGTGDFTMECWISPASQPSSFNAIIGTSATGGPILNLRGSGTSTSIGLNSYGSADIFNISYTFTQNVWTHIAVTRSGTSLKLFINGTQTGSTVTNSTNFSGYVTSIAMADNGNQYFNGYISNARIVKGTALYTSNFTPSTTPLTAVSGTSLLTCQSNRFIDNSSNNFAITVNGNTSVQRFSPFNPTAPYSTSVIGGSGYFDGTGDYLTVADNAALELASSDFTVEAWIYLSGLGGSEAIFSKYDYTTNKRSWQIVVQSDGSITTVLSSNGTSFAQNTTAAGVVSTGRWAHVALVRASGNVQLFVDGIVKIASFSYPTIYDADIPLYIGDRQDASNPFNGYISDARIVKGTALYTTTFTPPTSPLTAITNTSLLCNMTNAGIPDAAMMNDLETVGNAQVSTSVKKYGTGSLAFDGTGDSLKVSTSDLGAFGTGDFTIEMWVYFNSVSGTQNLIDFRAATADVAPTIALSSSALILYVTGSTRITTSTLSATTWYHVACVRNSGVTKMYINGTQSGSSYTDSNNYVGKANRPWIGELADGTTPAQPLNGYIDDLRITKGYARYTANFTPPTQALPTY